MTDNAIPLPGVSTVTSVTDWENVFAPGLVSGVISGLAPSLDGAGRAAVIGPGAALVRGFYKPVSVATSTSVPAASGQNRIDRLTLRLDRGATDPTLFVVPTVITGTPAAKPQKPALTQTSNGLWDLPVCSWTSTSAGALTSLTDERYFGGLVLSGVSSARPKMPAPGLLYETDTGMLAVWDGGSWSYAGLTPDTPHQITNFVPQGWHGSLQYAKVAPGLVAIAVEITLGGAASVGDGTVICNISSSYAPPSYHHVPLRCDAVKQSPQGGSNSYETASLSFRADGSVAAYGVGTAASVLEGTGCYPLAF